MEEIFKSACICWLVFAGVETAPNHRVLKSLNSEVETIEISTHYISKHQITTERHTQTKQRPTNEQNCKCSNINAHDHPCTYHLHDFGRATNGLGSYMQPSKGTASG